MSDADEKRRKAITEWWERQSIREFIARVRYLSKKDKLGGE